MGGGGEAGMYVEKDRHRDRDRDRDREVLTRNSCYWGALKWSDVSSPDYAYIGRCPRRRRSTDQISARTEQIRTELKSIQRRARTEQNRGEEKVFFCSWVEFLWADWGKGRGRGRGSPTSSSLPPMKEKEKKKKKRRKTRLWDLLILLLLFIKYYYYIWMKKHKAVNEMKLRRAWVNPKDRI